MQSAMICLSCLNESVEVRFDKKGRPYFICGDCGARFFSRSIKAIISLKFFSDYVKAIGVEKVRDGVKKQLDQMRARAASEISKGDKGFQKKTQEVLNNIASGYNSNELIR